MKFKHILFIVGCTLSIVTVGPSCTETSKDSQFNCILDEYKNDISHPFTGSAWDMQQLSSAPEYKIVEEVNGVRSIIYKSVNYRNKAKDVFAYYSTPGILKGQPELDKNLPAVVCVHGGGGKAFEEWVKIWARKGYAAISMDCRGYGKNRKQLENGFQEGPQQKTLYFKANPDQSEDWFYQAVADVVKAHSLIRSFEEVDKERTAITGISWGGIITTLVAGLDNRFKVAVPVYGCGYLYQTGSMAPQIKAGDALTQERWNTQYDPAFYVKNANIPMLFVDGTNDAHFFMDQWQSTTNLVKDAHRSVRLRMNHGHQPGWAPEEIYHFINNKLGINQSLPVPEFKDVQCQNNQISFEISANENSRIYLLSSNSNEINNAAVWQQKEIKMKDGKIKATLPLDTRMWILNVEYKEMNYSSDVYFKK